MQSIRACAMKAECEFYRTLFSPYPSAGKRKKISVIACTICPRDQEAFLYPLDFIITVLNSFPHICALSAYGHIMSAVPAFHDCENYKETLCIRHQL